MLAHEGLTRQAERDRKFAKRLAEADRRVLLFKKKWAKYLRPAKAPTAASVGKLTRQLWEFSEQVRLEPLSRREDRRRARP